MKIKAIITIIAFAVAAVANAANQGNTNESNGNIKVQVTKVSRPLVENWIKIGRA